MGDLVSVSQIAGQLGVSRRTVYGWIERIEDFPKPKGEIAGARVYDLGEVRRWHRTTDLRPGAASSRYARKSPPPPK